MNDTFVRTVYNDGDKDIYMPYWKKVVRDETIKQRSRDLEDIMEEDTFIDEDEVALKHPETGAVIKLRDDGSIEMFVNEDTGFRMDPKENAIMFFGDILHVTTKETRIHTKPHNFIWNNHNFNPELYSQDNGKAPLVDVDKGNKTSKMSLFQKSKRKTHFDKKVNELMKEVGIDFYRERG